MGTKCNPERVHVENYGATRNMSEVQPLVKKEEFEPEEGANYQAVSQITPLQEYLFSRKACVSPEKYSGNT